ncbi:MAG: response regulator [Myxococcota bacterium]
MPDSRIIAVVEDNPADQLIFRIGLRGLDAELHFYSTGEEALRGVALKQPTLLLLDFELPDINGFELIEKLQTSKIAQRIPILLLTGASHTTEQIIQAYELGALDYMVKPIPAPILKAKVRMLLRLFEQHQSELAYGTSIGEWIRQASSYERESSTSGSSTTVTQQLSGSQSLSKQAPARFASWVREYVRLFDVYQAGLLVESPKPVREMRALSRELGEVGAGPRDLMDIHVNVLEALSLDTKPTRIQNKTLHARLFALEMMGLLVEYYRLRQRRTPRRENTNS